MFDGTLVMLYRFVSLSHKSSCNRRIYHEFPRKIVSFSSPSSNKMPITEFVFASYKEDPESVAELRNQEAEIFKDFHGLKDFKLRIMANFSKETVYPLRQTL